ncbi:hypothetical protein KAR91_59130 [Candidatus Pacearchaeota archaeon]|nr:hypothetical protein [Candidatus Pacearchaeota archaeon]
MKKKQNERGYLLHAFGNKDLDYGKLAICCALSIKSNLKINHTTVVMDEWTKKWLETSISKDILSTAFDTIIIPEGKFQTGKRRHFDSPWVSFKSDFNNQSRVFSYRYSPYDETILIDSDFIIMNDSFDSIWDLNEDLMINNKAVDLQNDQFGSVEDKRLSNHGIPLYWATVVYFRKSEMSEIFFNLVDYIREEYNFFQFLYGFSEGFYRNDYSFSIAAHILNGYISSGIRSLPEDFLIMSYPKDTIAKLIDSNEIIFCSTNKVEEWKTTLVNIKELNLHIMNKREILRVSDKFIESCMEKI